MKIGSHVSIAGGIFNAPKNAADVGDEVFQIFSRSPQGGPVKPITTELITEFSQELKKYALGNFYIHTPYFINLASTKNNIYYGSISVIREELERGSLLGAKAVMTHLGSFGELSEEEGLEKVIKGIIKIVEGYEGRTKLLLEISAGAGKIVGDRFEEMAAVIFDKRLANFDIGICFDTCHAFASGYDLRTKAGIDGTLEQFDKTIGLEKLGLIHANDSMGELGDHKDRHQDIGKGKIGLAGFKLLAANKHLNKLDWILETPRDRQGEDKENVDTLKKIRDAI